MAKRPRTFGVGWRSLAFPSWFQGLRERRNYLYIVLREMMKR